MGWYSCWNCNSLLYKMLFKRIYSPFQQWNWKNRILSLKWQGSAQADWGTFKDFNWLQLFWKYPMDIPMEERGKDPNFTIHYFTSPLLWHPNLLTQSNCKSTANILHCSTFNLIPYSINSDKPTVTCSFLCQSVKNVLSNIFTDTEI